MAVTLRRPVPLERKLEVHVLLIDPDPLRVIDDPPETYGPIVKLLDGDELLAEAFPAQLDLDVPAPVSLPDAEDAATRFPYREGHAFPACFGCGPQREPGDGLRIFAGPVAGREDVFAAPWTPDASLADDDGAVRGEFVWAALDCSGGCRVANPLSTPPVVLGRLTARVERTVAAGRPHVVVAWALASEGRKREAGTAVYTPGGDLAALARALWIELK